MECTCPNCKTVFEQKVTRKKKTPKETDPRVNKLIDFYHDNFLAEHKEKPHINGGACGRMLKPLLTHKSQEELEEIIKEYIVCNDDFLREAGYPLLLLPKYIQKRAVSKKTAWDGLL